MSDSLILRKSMTDNFLIYYGIDQTYKLIEYDNGLATLIADSLVLTMIALRLS